MRKLILSTMLLTVLVTAAEPNFKPSIDWIDSDKLGHGVVMYFITDIGKERFNLSREQTFCLTLGIGLSKGVLDHFTGGTVDINDLIAGQAGWGIASLVNFTVEFD